MHTDFPDGAHDRDPRARHRWPTFEGADGEWRVIDDDGRVLDVLDSQPVDYVLVLSADPPSSTAGQFAPQGFGAAASLVQALTPELRARAQSVSVTPDGSDLRLLLDDGAEVRFGAAQDLVTKLVRLQTRLDELRGGGVLVHRRVDERGDDRVSAPRDARLSGPRRARMGLHVRSMRQVRLTGRSR